MASKKKSRPRSLVTIMRHVPAWARRCDSDIVGRELERAVAPWPLKIELWPRRAGKEPPFEGAAAVELAVVDWGRD